MRVKRLLWIGLLVLLAAAPAGAQEAPGALEGDGTVVFGVLLSGAADDDGWNATHVQAGRAVEALIPNTRMEVIENVNPTGVPPLTALERLVAAGARVVFVTSAAFEIETDDTARANPDVMFVQFGGDRVLTGLAPANVTNLSAQMEWAQMMAGCAAAMTSQRGVIGYLGGDITHETRRLASSAYLGARYCTQTYAGRDDLAFVVTWIGYRTPLSGVTLEPIVEANVLYSDADVIISAIDTQDALQAAAARADGRSFATGFAHPDACTAAPEVCLGTAYYNWSRDYERIIRSAIDGTWESRWDWLEPNWDAPNDPAESPIGFVRGAALPAAAQDALDSMLADMHEYVTNPFVPSSFPLWRGPLYLQSKRLIAQPGELVPMLDVWYLDELLDGMVGASG